MCRSRHSPFRLGGLFESLGKRISFAATTRLILSFLFWSALLQPALAQFSSLKITRIDIKHVGPSTVSDDLIRSHIRVKVGDSYLPPAVDDDVKSLYGTGFFYNIQVARKEENGGLILTYVVQEKPRLMKIEIVGNKKYGDKKLRKMLTSKVNEPMDERKLFTDVQEIQKKYQKAGYPRTDVKYTYTIEQDAGRANATITVNESPKVKIVEVDFPDAKAFKQKKLRKVVKTRSHWFMSWLTGSGFLKDDVLEEDKDKLREYYRDHGYLDFEIKDVQFVHPEPNRMIVKFVVYEGKQYHVGSVKFSGNKLFSNAEIAAGIRKLHRIEHEKGKLGTNGLPMDVGHVFSPKGYTKDVEAVEDFYGSKGYIDVNTSKRNLLVNKIPNTDKGTMDLEFNIDEGQKSFIERIEIRGNTRTKDKVIRRELAVSPGEVFDTVRVKISKQRLEGLQYFEPGRVDLRPEDTEPPISGRKDLVVGVEERNTGNLTLGAAFSSVDEIVGFAEFNQGNFDLFNPPTFVGGGQKLRLRVAVGTVRQDYVATFIEPWFLGRKLQFTTEFYHREANYQSLNDLYTESRTGFSVGLSKALWSDFLIGGITYTLEDVGIKLNENLDVFDIQREVPVAIQNEVGHTLLSRLRGSLAFDTRNSVQLPNKGQRTEVTAEMVGGPLGGEREFYKLHLSTAWYFRGIGSGDVIEVVGRTGVAEGLDGEEVPFYERYYLGGLYSLRGYKYRSVSPREEGISEPIGGDTYWFGSIEYSIPLFQQDRERGIGVRLAFFYDVGNVALDSYDYRSFTYFDDNYGVGLRLNLPIGPLRLDYGIPLSHDAYNGSSGRFQFGVGYTREF
jgi:outer membrane protein insertion porin family